MKTLETIVRRNNDGVEVVYGYAFYCPGCKWAHMLITNNPEGRPSWDFNNDFSSPTFSPSLLNRSPGGDDRQPGRPPRCHLFVRSGRIEYLDDCEHEYKGRTIDLPPFQWFENDN